MSESPGQSRHALTTFLGQDRAMSRHMALFKAREIFGVSEVASGPRSRRKRRGPLITMVAIGEVSCDMGFSSLGWFLSPTDPNDDLSYAPKIWCWPTPSWASSIRRISIRSSEDHPHTMDFAVIQKRNPCWVVWQHL